MDADAPASPSADPRPLERERPAGWQKLLPLAVLGVGAALAWVLLATSPAPERRPEPPRKVEVEVTAVTSTLHQVVLESQGTVRARMAGPVATQVAGQVLEVAEGFADGALVEAGALLARLDRPCQRLLPHQQQRRS